MIIRVRGPTGQSTIKLEPTATLADLQQLLQGSTGIEPECQEILGGFPPRALQLPEDRAGCTVAAVGIQAGDSLTVNRVAVPARPVAAAAGPTAAAVDLSHFNVDGMDEDEQLARALALSMEGDAPFPPAQQQQQQPRPAPPPRQASPVRAHPPEARNGSAANGSRPQQAQQQGVATEVPLRDGSAVVRRIIASDNSCLFNAVGYVMEHSRARAPALRKLIAQEVSSDPFNWSEAVLGKSPAEYCTWIQQSDKWGGAIELSILAKHYRREIAAFDIQTKRVDIYGQDAGYAERAMVIYDGLHYDALAVAAYPGAAEAADVTVLPSQGARTEEAMAGAAALVAAAHGARQFTDTANFTLRCGACLIGLKGEKEAVEHARVTGHTNFTEY